MIFMVKSDKFPCASHYIMLQIILVKKEPNNKFIQAAVQVKFLNLSNFRQLAKEAFFLSH